MPVSRARQPFAARKTTAGNKSRTFNIAAVTLRDGDRAGEIGFPARRGGSRAKKALLHSGEANNHGPSREGLAGQKGFASLRRSQ